MVPPAAASRTTDHPYGDLPAIAAATAYHTGDVLARFQVRAAEIAASTALITELTRQASTGRVSNWPPISPPRRPTSGVGIVEGWRGTITHRVELDPAGKLTRAKIVDPSFFNWPALPVALARHHRPDFPARQ